MADGNDDDEQRGRGRLWEPTGEAELSLHVVPDELPRTASDHVGLDERPDRRDEDEDGTDNHRGVRQRQRDVQECPPAAGAEVVRGLQEDRVHFRQGRKERQDHERKPDIHQREHDHLARAELEESQDQVAEHAQSPAVETRVDEGLLRREREDRIDTDDEAYPEGDHDEPHEETAPLLLRDARDVVRHDVTEREGHDCRERRHPERTQEKRDDDRVWSDGDCVLIVRRVERPDLQDVRLIVPCEAVERDEEKWHDEEQKEPERGRDQDEEQPQLARAARRAGNPLTEAYQRGLLRLLIRHRASLIRRTRRHSSRPRRKGKMLFNALDWTCRAQSDEWATLISLGAPFE